MLTTRPRKLFVNLPVRDLPASVAFFTRLGFAFNKQFTDPSATCMIVSEEAYVMLLTEARFADEGAKHTKKKALCDTSKAIEGLFCLSAESRAEVDEFADTAIAAGGTSAGEPQDHGFMYVRSFYDLDGHHWEILWMDPANIQPQA